MISRRIKELRKTLKLNQTDFGLKLGVSRSVILNIELDKVEPKEIFIEHICSVFSVNKSWILTGEGECFLPDAEAKHQIDELWAMYGSLKPEFQELIIKQIDALLEIQGKQIPPVS